MMIRVHYIILLLGLLVLSCKKDDPAAPLMLNKIYINSDEIDINAGIVQDVNVNPIIRLIFSEPIDQESLNEGVRLLDNSQTVAVNTSLAAEDKTINLVPQNKLENFTVYTLQITNELRSKAGSNIGAVEFTFKTVAGALQLESLIVNESEVLNLDIVPNVPLTLEMELNFTEPVKRSTLESAVSLTGLNVPALSFAYANNDQTVKVSATSNLSYLSKYSFKISRNLESVDGANFGGFSNHLFTLLDSTYKFPELSDEELLTLVQQQTFKYFWDFGHPVSGLSRERNTSGHTVASGASGFGLMTIPVGIERGFITRSEGVERLSTMINFLGDKAERFHGAWSHWLHGETGKAKPFSQKDDGGDLVETSFVAMGLMTVRQYLNEMEASEKSLIDKINTILDGIEWDWYRQGGQNQLYWHWSPNYGWDKNMKISGWNEAMITYFMAATSTSHAIPKEVYEEGWTRSGNFLNGNEYYGITLPMGHNYGGPLFFEQYTFLGIDPHNLVGSHGESYWEQVVNHTLINREHCVRNPKGYVGYSKDCWGLTASDGYEGYSAHSPTNDRGVITPTAALSSFPFTPVESMEALKHFYYRLGDRLWGPYGFYDAFSIQDEWYATSNIGIDQGPIVIMIENHRTGLLWDLFMSAPEVQSAMNLLGFTN
ncbi:Ig-like domain-containing protein [Carboxylicivirga mesophila]|uniref:Ig-like domain-containing protein n=1 Tax=Carboxylicivirga mesophila TaxID=1166478 RepID=A0ABS5K8Q0_9BACT|nr:glucoamylase family protein [Carboxylicivirga mesophila]MBS2211378.1 Ig-like domain-containing protein [Carboxylicivirga mesophila]